MRRKSLVAVVFSLTMLLGACGKQNVVEENDGKKSKTDNELIMAMQNSVTNLNVQLEGMKEGWIMLAPLYDQLYVKTEDEIRYYLADKVDISEDGKVITTTLKKNLKWHDGKPITADDLIFTLDCNKETKNGASFAKTVFINEKSVDYKKIDDLTIELRLPEVSASYLSILGNLQIIPKHVFNGDKDIINNEVANLKGIGSGPYKLKEFKEGEFLRLEKFDNYYNGTSSIDNVSFKIIPETSAQEVSIQKEEINFMEIANQKILDKYKSNNKLQTHSFPEGRVNYMICNKFSEIFKDKKVKEAIYASLDRDAIVLGAYGEKIAEPANSIFSNATLYYNADQKGYEHNVDKAKKLVKKTNLENNKLKLVFNSDRSFMKETALIMQQQLKDTGIELEIEPLESNAFFDKVFSDATDFDMYLNGYGAFGDPDEIISGMFDGTWGTNAEVSDKQQNLWKQGRKVTDEIERKEVYKKLQEQAHEDMTIYPIAFPNYSFVTSSRLEGTEKYKTIPIFEDYTQLKYK